MTKFYCTFQAANGDFGSYLHFLANVCFHNKFSDAKYRYIRDRVYTFEIKPIK